MLNIFEKVIDAAERWPELCHVAIVALCSGGGCCGEAMFACKLESIVSSALEAKLELYILNKKEIGFPASFDNAAFENWRAGLVDAAHTVDGIDQISSKRKVRIHYRGGYVGAVPVKSLVDEVETRIMACIKGIAVNSGILHPMNAEELMAYETDAADKTRKIGADFVLKAALISLSFCRHRFFIFSFVEPIVFKIFLAG